MRGKINIELVQDKIRQLEEEKALLTNQLVMPNKKIERVDKEIEIYRSRARFYTPKNRL